MKERFLSLEVSRMKGTLQIFGSSANVCSYFQTILLEALLFIYNGCWSGFSLSKAALGIASLCSAWCLWDSCSGAGGGWGQQGRKKYSGQKGRSDRQEKHTGLRNGEVADGKTPKHWPWRIFLLSNFIPLIRRNKPIAPMQGVTLDGLTLSSYFLMLAAFSILHLTCQSSGPQGMMLKDQGISCNHLRPSLSSPGPKSDCSLWRADLWRTFKGLGCQLFKREPEILKSTSKVFVSRQWKHVVAIHWLHVCHMLPHPVIASGSVSSTLHVPCEDAIQTPIQGFGNARSAESSTAEKCYVRTHASIYLYSSACIQNLLAVFATDPPATCKYHTHTP